jgi:hypothetical protein
LPSPTAKLQGVAFGTSAFHSQMAGHTPDPFDHQKRSTRTNETKGDFFTVIAVARGQLAELAIASPASGSGLFLTEDHNVLARQVGNGFEEGKRLHGHLLFHLCLGHLMGEFDRDRRVFQTVFHKNYSPTRF